MITDERLQGFQSVVAGLLGKATGLTNAPLGPAAALGFAGETVFRLVRLGYAVRRAQQEAGKQLNERVRLQDIPHEAVPLDLTDVVLADKISSGEFEAQFPEAAGQFRREIEEFRAGPPWSVPLKTRRILAFALRHVPALVRNGELESPELQRLFGQWLDPVRPDYRRLIGEMEQVLPAAELDTESHLGRSGRAFQGALELSGLRLDRLTAEEQAQLDRQVRTLVADAVLGPSALAERTLGFLVNLKKLHLDDELSRLECELSSIGAEQPGAAARKASLRDQIEKLKAWKARLA